MNEKPHSKAQKLLTVTQDVILIGEDFQTNDYEFQTLHDHRHPSHQQQQQVINPTSNYQQIEGPFFIQNDQSISPAVPQSQLQKEFQEIRFGSGECNLMDLDLQNDPTNKSTLQLTPFEYQQFIYNRVIEIQTPQLITEGYIMSYKLYQIKTRVIQKTQKHQQGSITKEISQFSKQCKILPNKASHHQKQQKEQEYDTCVSRRFSDFQYLNQLLISKFGGFIIPLLPEKNFWTIVNLQGRDYAQTRTKSLVKYLNRLFSHKKLKHSQQLKNFLFQQDNIFSTQKGEYLEKSKRIQDKIVSISSGALQYGKALYSRFLGGGGEKGRNEEEIRLNKNKLTKDDLTLSEYEIIVAQLMRIMSDLKLLVLNTIQQIQTIQDVKILFSSGLTDSFNIPTQKLSTLHSDSPGSLTLSQQSFSTRQISEQFQQISQFISSCHAAIQRRKTIRQQIQQLKQQQQVCIQRYRNSPRSLDLDIIRSKLSKLNKMNETYAEELIKELEFHIDEGKGMLRIFVVKFQNTRKTLYTQK